MLKTYYYTIDSIEKDKYLHIDVSVGEDDPIEFVAQVAAEDYYLRFFRNNESWPSKFYIYDRHHVHVASFLVIKSETPGCFVVFNVEPLVTEEAA